MALINELTKSVDDILNQEWNVRDGQVVPATEDVKCLIAKHVHFQAEVRSSQAQLFYLLAVSKTSPDNLTLLKLLNFVA